MDYMKYVWQMGIIMAVSFVGELFNKLLPLPVPASVYGLVIMLVLLLTGVVKLAQVEETANFLVKIMPIMFLGAGVSVMTVIGSVMEQLLGFVIVIVVSTIIVMVVTGIVAQLLLNRKGRAPKEERN